MYRSCIFCSADLKANDALERFPVGRSIAFDSEKGRLWAVCPACARWNLAPIEERWEAIEDAERLFRDTRSRVQSENIGVARLRDGTRLVRVGDALAGELAVWRYGAGMVQRRRRYLAMSGIGIVAAGGLFTAGMLTVGGGYFILQGASYVRRRLHARRPVAHLTAEETGTGLPAVIRRDSALVAQFGEDADGTFRLRLPKVQAVLCRDGGLAYRPVILHGDSARRVLPRVMVVANAAGANRALVEEAVNILARERSPAEYVRRMAGEKLWLGPHKNTRSQKLALEMALHEEAERRALDGELAGLEEMWRQAEGIAAIADRLPDDLPAGT